MSVIVISAMSPQGVIGKDGVLPWHDEEEYGHFLRSVRGQVMVMGRKSWEVFGSDVQTMANLVLSKREHIKGAFAFKSMEEALKKAGEFQADCFIAGGGEIYRKALELDVVDEMWLSTIKIEVEGDVCFPEFDKKLWSLKQKEDRGTYLFRVWVRNKRSV